MKPWLSIFVALSLASRVALADPSDADRTKARGLAHEGFDAQQRGDYAVAADRFLRADALVHAPTLLLGLARAQVGLGKLLAAHETYDRILREPLPPHAPAVFGKAVEDAKREVLALDPRLGWMTIRVEGATSPDVTIDDASVPAATLGARRPCDPGPHVIRGTAPGFQPAEVRAVVAEGGDQTVTLSMDPLPPPHPPVAAATPSDTATPFPSKPLMWGAFGVSAAGLITGTVTGLVAAAKHSSLSSTCEGGCPAADSGEVYGYRTLANVSTGAFVIAGVGAAAGITILLVDPKANPFRPYVGWMSAGVVGTF